VEALEDINDLPMIVAGCDLFLLVLSDGVLDSRFCMEELAAAVEVGVPIVLVVKEGSRWPDDAGNLKADFPIDARIATLEPPSCRRGFSAAAIKHSNEYYSAFSKKLQDRVRVVIEPIRQHEPQDGDEPAGSKSALARRQMLMQVRETTDRVPVMPGSHAATGQSPPLQPSPPQHQAMRAAAADASPPRRTPAFASAAAAVPAGSADMLGTVIAAMQQQVETHAKQQAELVNAMQQQQADMFRAMQQQADSHASALQQQAEACAAAMSSQLETILAYEAARGTGRLPEQRQVVESPHPYALQPLALTPSGSSDDGGLLERRSPTPYHAQGALPETAGNQQIGGSNTEAGTSGSAKSRLPNLPPISGRPRQPRQGALRAYASVAGVTEWLQVSGRHLHSGAPLAATFTQLS
jgi:hypothetical protein